MRVSPPVVRAGVDREVAKQQRMEIAGDRSYIEFIARTEQAAGRRQYCEDQIGRVLTQLSAILTPALFAQELWSGWLSDPEQLVADLWLMTAPTVGFKPEEVEKQLAQFADSVGRYPDIESRFTLMSKLFARAVAIEPGEERFLWLWTVLEVFPMKNTSDIRPISEHLSRVTGRPSAEIKDKLEIGRLFGARSDLVHEGKLPYDRNDLGAILTRLEAMIVTVLRSLGGLPYAGQLQQYLE
ncbi:MAG TPA: hypothetical protein VI386_27185 [Candidatus Sulfotelmatobacter sp.]